MFKATCNVYLSEKFDLVDDVAIFVYLNLVGTIRNVEPADETERKRLAELESAILYVGREAVSYLAAGRYGERTEFVQKIESLYEEAANNPVWELPTLARLREVVDNLVGLVVARAYCRVPAGSFQGGFKRLGVFKALKNVRTFLRLLRASRTRSDSFAFETLEDERELNDALNNVRVLFYVNPGCAGVKKEEVKNEKRRKSQKR